VHPPWLNPRRVSETRLEDMAKNCLTVLKDATARYNKLLDAGKTTASADWSGKYEWSSQIDNARFQWGSMMRKNDMLFFLQESKFGREVFNTNDERKINSADFLGMPLADVLASGQNSEEAAAIRMKGGV
jgi:hypothetical protein